MQYRVLDENGRVERETSTGYLWHVVSPGRLHDELVTAGYAVSAHDPDVLVAVPELQ